MSTTGRLWLIAAVWVVIGLVVALVMRRRGHDFYGWLVLGVVLGPLSIPLAFDRARFYRMVERRSAGTPSSPQAGFDLLAGLDGSDAAIDAVNQALGLVGGLVSSLTITTVLDHDAKSTPTGMETQAEARAMLEAANAEISYEPVDIVLLYGRPAEAIAEHARTSGIELIVVGARGHGASEALFGSVAGRLVGLSEVPVLVGSSAG